MTPCRNQSIDWFLYRLVLVFSLLTLNLTFKHSCCADTVYFEVSEPYLSSFGALRNLRSKINESTCYKNPGNPSYITLREKCPNTEFFLVLIWTLFTQCKSDSNKLPKLSTKTINFWNSVVRFS